MTHKFHFITIVILCLLVACNKLTDEQKADIRINNARAYIANNQLNTAKLELDSVHILYRKEVAKRRIADHLSDSINYIESKRTLAYCDSILQIKTAERDKLRKEFRYEKDELYETVGTYVYYLLRTVANAERCYLQPYVTEDSDVYLKSTYHGSFAIEHSQIMLTSNEVSISSPVIPTSDAANHTFSDGGFVWEMLDYKNEDALSLLNFVSANEENQIKVTLLGKRKYNYSLMDSEKKALAATYHLGVVMRDIVQLEQESKKAQTRIVRFERKTKKL